MQVDYVAKLYDHRFGNGLFGSAKSSSDSSGPVDGRPSAEEAEQEIEKHTWIIFAIRVRLKRVMLYITLY